MLHYGATTQTLSDADSNCLQQNADAALELASHLMPPTPSMPPPPWIPPAPPAPFSQTAHSFDFYGIHGSARQLVSFTINLAFTGSLFAPLTNQALMQLLQHLFSCPRMVTSLFR